MTEGTETRKDAITNKLRKFQLLLKREDNLNTYYDSEIERIPTCMEKEYENFLHMNKILLAYHMYSINNAGFVLKPSVFDSLRANPQTSEKRSLHIKYDQKATEQYRVFFSYFHNEVINFSTVCMKLALKKKEMIDILTFSVIPSFFSFLSTKKKIEQFLSFMNNVFTYEEQLGCQFSRLIFVLPEFRVFFAKIVEKLKIPIQNLSSSDIPNFVTDFCNYFKKYVYLCPSIVRQVMEFAKDQTNFLKESFLIPAFTQLRQFGLIPYYDTIASGLKGALKSAMIGVTSDLVTMINESDSSTSLATVGDINGISPNLENMYLFTYYDLLAINQMTDVTLVDGVHIDKISSIPFLEPDDYSVFVLKYCFNQKVAPSETVQLSSLDDLESNLRALLTKVNVIPVGVEGKSIEDVIDMQSLLVSEDKRFRLKLEEEILKKNMERVINDGITYSFEELVDFMKQKFDERDSERKEEVARLSSMKTKIINVKNMKDRLDAIQKNTLLNSFQYQLIEKWSKESNPTSLINDSIYEGPDQFSNVFGSIADNFRIWLESNGYQKANDFSLVHNFVMLAIPLDHFIEHYKIKDLRAEDRKFYQKVRDRKDKLLENVRDKEEWLEPFLQDKKLIEPLLKLINAYYSAKTPIEKFIKINELKVKVYLIVIREGEEFGADQQWPVVVMTEILSQPKNYISNLEYLEYFYLNIYKKYPFLMDIQQTEHSFDLIKMLIDHDLLKDD